MTSKGHIPLRTCIGCRRKKKKEEMVWLTYRGERVIRVDGRKPHRGRGFYLCPDLRCLKMAKEKKKPMGSLRTVDFEFLLMEGFSKSDQVGDRGGRE